NQSKKIAASPVGQDSMEINNLERHVRWLFKAAWLRIQKSVHKLVSLTRRRTSGILRHQASQHRTATLVASGMPKQPVLRSLLR
ncbi:hypothetical protein, partial [Burkholderia sp. LMG 13014]